jgi:hypothetical protein
MDILKHDLVLVLVLSLQKGISMFLEREERESGVSRQTGSAQRQGISNVTKLKRR